MLHRFNSFSYNYCNYSILSNVLLMFRLPFLYIPLSPIQIRWFSCDQKNDYVQYQCYNSNYERCSTIVFLVFIYIPTKTPNKEHDYVDNRYSQYKFCSEPIFYTHDIVIIPSFVIVVSIVRFHNTPPLTLLTLYYMQP